MICTTLSTQKVGLENSQFSRKVGISIGIDVGTHLKALACWGSGTTPKIIT